MIESFADTKTAAIYHGYFVKGFPLGILPVARRKLDMLSRAVSLQDLRSPPGNRLEALKGSRSGFHSIRINNQWRIIFKWNDGAAREVLIIDYH
ncbi:MAG: type II toxin-antitoxin system RelE/ParE family toxin [Planctomycetes bacterium]|nr:type II toxin-antitoxin system RelE/ParE family toxin [Planctomycetota bacterium]